MKAITVKELISALKEVDPNALVALSCDSEGNSFSLMANEMFVTLDSYMTADLGSQDTYFEEKDIKASGDTVKDFYGNETKKDKLVKAIILWPTN